jgi:hypothetical protein
MTIPTINAPNRPMPTLTPIGAGTVQTAGTWS